MSQALRDPWEKTNRKVYALNRGLDRYALRPAATVYRKVIPTPLRRGVTNVFNNLQEPVSFINAVLQGKPKRAWHTLQRFVINTTIGVGGLADHATELGRPEESEDFGQTLAVWGVKSGPYVMLPFFGPSTLRDTAGIGVDFATDPVPYVRNSTLHPSAEVKVGLFALQTLNLRSKLIDAGADGVLEGSLDEYATVRSAFLQRRQSQIYDGNPPEEDDDAPVEDAPLAPGATPQAGAATAVPTDAAAPLDAEPVEPAAQDAAPTTPSPAAPQPASPTPQ